MNTCQLRGVLRNVLRLKHLFVKVCVVFVLTFVLMSLVSTFPDEQQDDQFIEQRYYTPSEKAITPLNYSFTITNEHICQQDQPYLIGIVPTRMWDYMERRAIRKTYGSMSRDKVAIVNGVKIEHVVRFVFVVGKSNNHSIEMELFKENKQYRDMVQVDMIDSYYNLTLKVLMALKWVDTFCPSVKYVLKVDDDVFVHIGLLLNQIHSIKHSNYGNIFGEIPRDKNYFIVHRKNSKWAVSKETFPLYKYPVFAQGTSYTMTRDLVPKIIQKAQYLPYLPNEDVFLTGVIGGRLLGATLEALNKSSYWAMDTPEPCLFAEDNELAHSAMTPALMFQTWKALQENNINCKSDQDRLLLVGFSDHRILTCVIFFVFALCIFKYVYATMYMRYKTPLHQHVVHHY